MLIENSIKRIYAYHVAIIVLGLFYYLSFSLSFAFGSDEKPNMLSQQLELINLRIMGDDSRVRVISIYNIQPETEVQFLGTPPRLIINLPKTSFSLSPNSVTSQGLVKTIRYGNSGAQNSRIIFGIETFFQVEPVSLEQLESGLWQQVFDIVGVSKDVFDQSLKKQQEQQRLKLQQVNKNTQNRIYRIVLDAGHGGKDSGALGTKGGTLEKDITLSFAKALKASLEKHSNIEVYLTRDDDTFLRLGERVAKARSLSADLFISIHADSIQDNSLRGATVYTISDKASDSIARSLAESENKSDLLDGLPADDYPEIADILLDLAQKETHKFSVLFADQLVRNLQENDVHMIKNPHRFAGFQVLRAPDIPSILIEVGYLSNGEDEKLITNELWREKLADLMAKTIYNFIAKR